METQITMDYYKYKELVDENEKLKELVEALKEKDNVIILDYSNAVHYMNYYLPSIPVIRKCSEESVINEYKEKFDNLRQEFKTLEEKLRNKIREDIKNQYVKKDILNRIFNF
jgi:cell division protein FtsB